MNTLIDVERERASLPVMCGSSGGRTCEARGCDAVEIQIGNMLLNVRVRSRAMVVQHKTRRPVRLELLDHAQASP